MTITVLAGANVLFNRRLDARRAFRNPLHLLVGKLACSARLALVNRMTISFFACDDRDCRWKGASNVSHYKRSSIETMSTALLIAVLVCFLCGFETRSFLKVSFSGYSWCKGIVIAVPSHLPIKHVHANINNCVEWWYKRN